MHRCNRCGKEAPLSLRDDGSYACQHCVAIEKLTERVTALEVQVQKLERPWKDSTGRR